jgi:hypothetical protein
MVPHLMGVNYNQPRPQYKTIRAYYLSTTQDFPAFIPKISNSGRDRRISAIPEKVVNPHK